jgi:ferredoxin
VALEVTVDAGACMGAGECSFHAPGVFDHDDAGIAFVVDANAAPEETVVQAARCCPNFAISVTKDGEKLV